MYRCSLAAHDDRWTAAERMPGASGGHLNLPAGPKFDDVREIEHEPMLAVADPDSFKVRPEPVRGGGAKSAAAIPHIDSRAVASAMTPAGPELKGPFLGRRPERGFARYAGAAIWYARRSQVCPMKIPR